MKLPFKIDLTDKVIVITGAGGVLCSMFARALALCGGKIALLDINEELAAKYAAEIVNGGCIAKAYAANVLDRDDLERVRNDIIEDFGTCDILINGAGGNSPSATTDNEFHDISNNVEKDFFSLKAKDVEFVFNLNFLGSLLPSQVFAKDMIGKKGCSILNISSMNSFKPLTKIPAYSGAKAAISNFTKWLAVYFSKCNIRVNAIAPGFFVTNQNHKLLYDDNGNPTKRTEKILKSTPLERFGKSEELLGALLFLLSESAASFVTGVVLPVDGGFSAYSGV